MYFNKFNISFFVSEHQHYYLLQGILVKPIRASKNENGVPPIGALPVPRSMIVSILKCSLLESEGVSVVF